jgi:hypothetical protein
LIFKELQKGRWNMEDTPLEGLPDWSEEQISKLKTAWITTAEQVVALSATTYGIRSLAEQLQTSEDEVRRLVEIAKAKLAPEVRAEMEKAADTSEYGLGANPLGKEEDDR